MTITKERIDQDKTRNKRQPKPKSYRKAVKAIEEAKKQIAQAAGESLHVDVEELDRLANEAAIDIAKKLNLPVNNIKVVADIVYDSSDDAAPAEEDAE